MQALFFWLAWTEKSSVPVEWYLQISKTCYFQNSILPGSDGKGPCVLKRGRMFKFNGNWVVLLK